MTTTLVDGEVLDSQDEPTEPATPDVGLMPGKHEQPAPAEPSIPELVERFGGILAFEAAFKSWLHEQRQDLESRMIDAHQQIGAKSFTASYGDQGGAVTFSLRGSSEKFTVTDEKELRDWVEENFEDEVETVIQIKPAFRKQLLDKMLTGVGESAFVKETTLTTKAGVAGEEVPGVKYTPASDDPTGFGTSWKKDGKQAALAALAPQQVGALLGITTGGDQ